MLLYYTFSTFTRFSYPLLTILVYFSFIFSSFYLFYPYLLQLHSSEDAPYAHRNSSEITSPPALEAPSILLTDADNGFYMLKKDSHRRSTLVCVLTEDASVICNTWLLLLQQNIQGLLLKTDHLQTLLMGLRGFIPDQDKSTLVQAISMVKEELEFDGNNQIQLALLLVQDAINRTLRCHNIKPHWMFALDSLVRSAVQAAITILSPELGENLAGDSQSQLRQVSFEADSDTTPTINSKSLVQHSLHKPEHTSMETDQYQDLKVKYEKLENENIQLWQKLVSAEASLNLLLKNQISEKQEQAHLLLFKGSNNYLNQNTNPSIVIEHVKRKDEALIEWLHSLNMDQETIDKVSLILTLTKTQKSLIALVFIYSLLKKIIL